MKRKIGIPMEGFAEFSKKVASEGVVLLKNENDVLPFQKNETISIFGRCQIEYYRSGTGSGGAVNVAYNTNILDVFDKSQVNETLADLYRAFIKENPFDTGGGGWACEPWSQKEMALTPEIVAEAKRKSDKALIVIGRTAGEDKDNLDVAGSYRLTELEERMVKEVTAVFDRVCIVLNISNVIDMSWSEKYNIDGIVCSWNGGMEGGGATVDVLMGKVCRTYEISVQFKLQATDLAQIFFMLKLNDETAAVMLTGNTNGKVVRKKLREIQLEKGSYTAELEVGSDTFFVELIEIKKVML